MILKDLTKVLSAVAYIKVIDSKKHICIYEGCNCDFKNACHLYPQYINRKIENICDGMHQGGCDNDEFSDIEIYVY